MIDERRASVGGREFIASQDVLDRPAQLRARLAINGYLYFPGLLPVEDVLRVRRAILACCRAANWLVPGTDLMDAIADPAHATVEPEPAFLAVYADIQRLEFFHALANHPALLGLIESVLGEPGISHPSKVARFTFPQSIAYTTPAHQDFPFVQGAAETFTTWIPLGACPRELGGLEVNVGSHTGGVHEHHLSMGAGAMEINPATLPDNWHSTDYAAGDVLLFHSMTVHRAIPNLTRDRLRVSVDYRHQARSEPIAAANLAVHKVPLTWEEVYRGWQSTDRQYYWEKVALNVVELDPAFVRTRDREAFERAAQGDPIARPALMRIAQRDKDPATRERAQKALADLDRQASPHLDP